MYLDVHLCETLQPRERCIRLQRYAESRFSVLLHQHVASYRLSMDGAMEAIRALGCDTMESRTQMRCAVSSTSEGRRHPHTNFFTCTSSIPNRREPSPRAWRQASRPSSRHLVGSRGGAGHLGAHPVGDLVLDTGNGVPRDPTILARLPTLDSDPQPGGFGPSEASTGDMSMSPCASPPSRPQPRCAGSARSAEP